MADQAPRGQSATPAQRLWPSSQDTASGANQKPPSTAATAGVGAAKETVSSPSRPSRPSALPLSPPRQDRPKPAVREFSVPLPNATTEDSPLDDGYGHFGLTSGRNPRDYRAPRRSPLRDQAPSSAFMRYRSPSQHEPEVVPIPDAYFTDSPEVHSRYRQPDPDALELGRRGERFAPYLVGTDGAIPQPNDAHSRKRMNNNNNNNNNNNDDNDNSKHTNGVRMQQSSSSSSADVPTTNGQTNQPLPPNPTAARKLSDIQLTPKATTAPAGAASSTAPTKKKPRNTYEHGAYGPMAKGPLCSENTLFWIVLLSMIIAGIFAFCAYFGPWSYSERVENGSSGVVTWRYKWRYNYYITHYTSDTSDQEILYRTATDWRRECHHDGTWASILFMTIGIITLIPGIVIICVAKKGSSQTPVRRLHAAVLFLIWFAFLCFFFSLGFWLLGCFESTHNYTTQTVSTDASQIVNTVRVYWGWGFVLMAWLLMLIAGICQAKLRQQVVNGYPNPYAQRGVLERNHVEMQGKAQARERDSENISPNTNNNMSTNGSFNNMSTNGSFGGNDYHNSFVPAGSGIDASVPLKTSGPLPSDSTTKTNGSNASNAAAPAAAAPAQSGGYAARPASTTGAGAGVTGARAMDPPASTPGARGVNGTAGAAGVGVGGGGRVEGVVGGGLGIQAQTGPVYTVPASSPGAGEKKKGRKL